ncbi:MAG: FHA domain-containing protein [Planctomycetota bacterium]|jgi:hypothetical protein
MIRLCVTTAAGRSTFVTDRNEVLLGSREGADLRVEADGVAANHCMLRADGGALMLVDLGSPTGVSFAGQPVRQARLQPGSAFRIGDVLVEVEAVGAPPVPPKQKLQLAPATLPAALPAGGPAELVAHGPHADFGRELKKKLATAPWYAISAAVHALILLVMSLIPYERIEKYSLQQIKAELAEDGSELEEQADDLEPDIESLHEDEPEDDFEELLETEKKEKKDDSIPMQMDERPELIGIGQPKLNKRISPLTSPNTLKATEGEKNISRSDAAAEQKKARSVVAKGFGRGLKRLQTIPRDRIVVVEGEFDEMQSILKIYDIPHTLIRRHHLTSYKLDRAKVVCINCGRSPTPLQKNILVNKVKAFAKKGGWVITSDWALAPYLTEAFPQYVHEIPAARRQPDTTVEVRAKAAQSPLIEGVFARRTRTRWWLEEASKFVGRRGNKVQVLIDSPEMKQTYGSGLVAIAFKPSRNGRVIHLIGHFFQKDGNRAGVVGMHRLILNVLKERFVGKVGER